MQGRVGIIRAEPSEIDDLLDPCARGFAGNGLCGGTVLLLDWSIGLTLAQQLTVGVGLALLVPVVFFRYARSLWLGLDFLITSADQRADRRRRR